MSKPASREQIIDAAVRRFVWPFEMLEHYRCCGMDVKKQDKLMKKNVIAGRLHDNICAEFRRLTGAV